MGLATKDTHRANILYTYIPDYAEIGSAGWMLLFAALNCGARIYDVCDGL